MLHIHLDIFLFSTQTDFGLEISNETFTNTQKHIKHFNHSAHCFWSTRKYLPCTVPVGEVLTTHLGSKRLKKTNKKTLTDHNI